MVGSTGSTTEASDKLAEQAKLAAFSLRISQAKPSPDGKGGEAVQNRRFWMTTLDSGISEKIYSRAHSVREKEIYF